MKKDKDEFVNLFFASWYKMFKRYKSPMEQDSHSYTATATEETARPSSYQEAPPRIYTEEAPTKTPYTPTASYTEPTPQPKEVENHEPDTTLGKGVAFKGELTFERFLRIDGNFEGELVSDGKLHVGPSGTVKSNITMSEAIIEGVVEGNINVTGRLELRSQAEVQGDIEAGTLSVDEGVTIVGNVCVTPNNDS